MAKREQIKAFFSSPSFGVVGASNNSAKFGNKVLRKYLQHGLVAFPINPGENEIEGLACLKSVKELPDACKSISIVTPPAVTEKIVREAMEQGIENIWMQPGAESLDAVQYAEEHGINVIADGSCVMVALG